MFLVMQVTDPEILSVLRGRTLVSKGWGFVCLLLFLVNISATENIGFGGIAPR